MQRRIILMLCLIILSGFPVFAQKTMLIKGTVIDKSTNKPLELEINVKGETGKKYRINSNVDGTYSTGIEGGDTYSISVKGYLISEQEHSITIPKTEYYKEYNRDLHISKFATGMELYSLNLFNPGTAVLSTSAEERLKEIRDDLAFHNAKVNFIVSTCDYYNKTKKKRAASTKQLMTDRIKVLRDICFKLNFRQSNVDYFEDIVINAKAPKSPKDQFKVVIR
jgi:hypothetical protein